MPVISNSSGFVSTPLNGMLIIGESTCSSIQETVIMCPIRFGPDLCEINYSWMRDGQPLEGQNNFTIFATERGIYSCVVTSKCGEDVATSELYGQLVSLLYYMASLIRPKMVLTLCTD